MKNAYLLRAFLFALIWIFILLVVELQLFEIAHRSLNIFFGVANLVIFLFAILSIWSFIKFTSLINREKYEKEADRLQLNENQKMITTLQSQRHDFKNQLQVIKVLAYSNKIDAIIKYIDDCYGTKDFSNLYNFQIENPIISAMLLYFAADAKEKGISFNVDCDLDFSQFNLPPARITRILSNIIQNAIESFQGIEKADASIQVTIWETPEFYNFIIWNNGPVIPESIIQEIFKAGLSTKKSSGLGLAIVQELINELHGSVSVQSDSEVGTEFKINIVKKNKIEPSHIITNIESDLKFIK